MIDLSKVDISKIKQDVVDELVVEQEIDLGMIEDVKLTSPVSIKLHLIKIDQGITLSGILKGEVLLQCDRCLESFNYKIKRDFKIDICEEKHKVESEKAEYNVGELKKEELEKSVCYGNNVNLMEEIRQQIILSLPMKQICKEDCQGLCSNCGVNLNKTTCSCSLENIDPRLAPLKEVLRNGKSKTTDIKCKTG